MEQIDKIVDHARFLVNKMRNGVRSTFAAVTGSDEPEVRAQPQAVRVVAPRVHVPMAAAPVVTPPVLPQAPRRHTEMSYEQAILSGRNKPLLAPPRRNQQIGIRAISDSLMGNSANRYDSSIAPIELPIPGVVTQGTLNENIPIATGSSSFGNVPAGTLKSQIPAEMHDLFSNTDGMMTLKGRGK